MSKNSSIEIRGHQLAEKLGINISEYTELPKAGHGLYQPRDLLDKDSKKKLGIEQKDFDQLKKITNDTYNTGEIWYDATYEIYYLILGKVSEEHVVLTLGGDIRSAGVIEKGVINSGDDAHIFCDKIIFRPRS